MLQGSHSPHTFKSDSLCKISTNSACIPVFTSTWKGLFDGGAVVDYLKIVKTFLDANPNEVLTFIFTNPEGVSLPDVWKPAFDEAGTLYN